MVLQIHTVMDVLDILLTQAGVMAMIMMILYHLTCAVHVVVDQLVVAEMMMLVPNQ